MPDAAAGSLTRGWCSCGHCSPPFALVDRTPMDSIGSSTHISRLFGLGTLAGSTTAGAVDIYGKDADGTPTIVELKRRRVGPDAVGQLNRYVNALKRDLAAGRSVRGLLVAPSVTERAQELLTTEELEFVSLTTEGADTSQPTRLTEFSNESRH